MKICFFALAVAASLSFASDAEARGMSTEEHIIRGQMETATLNEQLIQHKIDLARSRCERNGGTFDMSMVKFASEEEFERKVRSRDRGAIYRRGRTININLGQVLFGSPRGEVDIKSTQSSDVRIPDSACNYKK